MIKEYNSVYGPHMERYTDLKIKLGFKFSTGRVILYQIDRLAVKRGETGPGITKEFAREWGKKRPMESESSRYSRMGKLIQFSSYLRDIGVKSHIPGLPRMPKSTFIPYIYSPTEVRALFKACDELRLKQRHSSSCLVSMPAIIRLLYATGLRLGEALELRDGDIDLDNRYLCVKDSKNGKQRIIPIPDSLASVCREYREYRDDMPFKEHRSEYFFVNFQGKKCGQCVRQWFRKCLERAGITYMDRGRGPRVHDLRHTFAVTSLAAMAEEGIDLYASLPILSSYLGHQSIGATDHYVRLTSNMYPGLIKDVNMVCLDVFPKFHNYEAD